MLADVKTNVKSAVKNALYFNRHKDKIGISKRNFLRFKKFGRNEKLILETEFQQNAFEITSPYWFLHSLDEIYVQEVYRYVSREKAPVILDCGANIGLSVLYFKKLYPAARITAFEADPKIYGTLQKNLSTRQLQDVELVNAAVWVNNAAIEFESDGTLGGKIDTEHHGKNGVEVRAIRLRDYLQQPIDFLKIDIEGAEYEVLKDCRDLLGNANNLFIEYHVFPNEEQRLHEILGWVHDAGFKYYIREAWNNMSYPFLQSYDDYYQLQLNISCYKPR